MGSEEAVVDHQEVVAEVDLEEEGEADLVQEEVQVVAEEVQEVVAASEEAEGVLEAVDEEEGEVLEPGRKLS